MVEKMVVYITLWNTEPIKKHVKKITDVQKVNGERLNREIMVYPNDRISCNQQKPCYRQILN